MIRIGFIEDNVHYLRSLQAAFHLNPDIYCVIAVHSIEAFWDRLPKHTSLDILFIDIDLPGQSGIQGLTKLRNQRNPVFMLFQNGFCITMKKCRSLHKEAYE